MAHVRELEAAATQKGREVSELQHGLARALEAGRKDVATAQAEVAAKEGALSSLQVRFWCSLEAVAVCVMATILPTIFKP